MPSAATATTLITSSKEAWKMLNGVVCLYKPLGYCLSTLKWDFRNRLVEGLIQLEPSPRKEIVQIRRVEENSQSSPSLENEEVISSIQDGAKRIEIVKGLGYSDHPLVIGPNFKPDQIKFLGTGRTSPDVSGVHLFGINKGTFTAQKIFHGRWVRTYLISGKFGIATDTFFHTGRIQEKSTYGSIKRFFFEKFLASVQSSHQRLSFQAAGVPLESERAYELASQGLVRPATGSASMIYSIRCTEFDLPNFTVEVKAVNEDADYLKRLIHEIGLKNRSVATCTKIQCTNVGPFGLNDALLSKHWTLQNIIGNMKNCRNILQNFKLDERKAWIEAGANLYDQDQPKEQENRGS